VTQTDVARRLAAGRDRRHDVVERAAARGVLLHALDDRYGGTPGVHGLVLGYGGATVSQIRSGCSLVRELVQAPVRSRA
jgi:GntR family transcriptional regulator/MocR family aminotransferase